MSVKKQFSASVRCLRPASRCFQSAALTIRGITSKGMILSLPDRDEVDKREAEADGDRGEACRSATVGSAHDHEQEDGREHSFNQECRKHARGLAAKGVQAVLEGIGPAVSSEGADASVGEVGACNYVKDRCCDDTANDLGGDVWAVSTMSTPVKNLP